MKKILFFYIVFIGAIFIIPLFVFREVETSLAYDYVSDYTFIVLFTSCVLAFYFQEILGKYNRFSMNGILSKILNVFFGIIFWSIIISLSFSGSILFVNANFGKQKIIKVDAEIIDAQPKRTRGRWGINRVRYEIETEKIPELGRGLKIDVSEERYKEIENWRYQAELKIGSIGIVYK